MLPPRADFRHFMGDDPRRGGKLRIAALRTARLLAQHRSTRKSAARYVSARPFACDALHLEPRGRAPNLSEHTRQVLTQDLG